MDPSDSSDSKHNTETYRQFVRSSTNKLVVSQLAEMFDGKITGVNGRSKWSLKIRSRWVE